LSETARAPVRPCPGKENVVREILSPLFSRESRRRRSSPGICLSLSLAQGRGPVLPLSEKRDPEEKCTPPVLGLPAHSPFSDCGSPSFQVLLCLCARSTDSTIPHETVPRTEGWQKCSQGTEEGSGGSGRLPVFFRFFQSAPEEGKGLCKKIIGGQGILPDLVLGGFLCSQMKEI
jgi:hypothetical protein